MVEEDKQAFWCGDVKSSDIGMINPLYLTDEFASDFKKTLSGGSKFSKPFPHFSLPNFLIRRKFVDDLRLELRAAEFHHKENDLFSLNQTSDLENFDAKKYPNLVNFRNLFKTDVLRWLKKVSGVDLNSEVAITSSNYNHTDLLLPHDDQCEGRAFAFILYLTPEWKESDGGQLVLYNCDDDNNPISVAKVTNPVENTLMMFEVSPRSWHMVTEVLSQKGRLSLHGWFHCNVYDMKQVKLRSPALRQKPHMNITYEEVLEWINPVYIDPTQQFKIRQIFEENSEINLIDFIRTEKFESALRELDNADFEDTGPPNKMKLSRLREYALPADSILPSLLRLVQSQAMALLLSQWTGIPLHPLDETDTDEPDVKRKKSDGSEGGSDPSYEGVECCSSTYRIGKGCYTMVDDQIVCETECSGCCLDFMLFLCAKGWDDKHGGFISYFAKNEEEEVLRVSPVGNSVALVFREPGVYPFIKYVNSKAEDRQYFLVNCSFYGMAQSDVSDEGDEESGEAEESGGAGTSGLGS